MRLNKIGVVVLIGLTAASGSYAADLLEVYQQAQGFDPTLKKAAAQRLSKAELLPQSQAALLPNLSGQASTFEYSSHNSLPASAANPKAVKYGVTGYALSLTQPVFNFASWMTVRQADASVKQADALYGVALQDLILRSAQAYFNVLKAEDALRITAAQKKLLAKQLDEAKQRFEVGLNTVTEVYNAQASYDAAVAQEITDRNDVNNQYENLGTISGQRYHRLALLDKKIPLIAPNPANVDKWVQAAEQQNLALKAARFAVDAARENIKVQAGGHLPSLSASGTYSKANGGILNQNTPIAGVAENTSLGLTLTVPLYQGGLVNSQTRQAQYDFASSAAEMEINHQNVLAKTRQYYATVLADISKLEADRAAVTSARSAYESNLAAYQVGTKTNVDVLSAQKDLFNAQRKYSGDQYAYLIDTLILKQLAGTLNEKDLQIINSWLKVVDGEDAAKRMEKALGVKMIAKPARKKAVKKKV